MHAVGVWQVNKLTAALCRVWLVLMNETLARLFFVQQSFIFYPKDLTHDNGGRSFSL